MRCLKKDSAFFVDGIGLRKCRLINHLCLAIDFDRFAQILCRAICMLIDIIFKSFIAHIHLTKTCQDLLCTQIVIVRTTVFSFHTPHLLILLYRLPRSAQKREIII